MTLAKQRINAAAQQSRLLRNRSARVGLGQMQAPAAPGLARAAPHTASAADPGSKVYSGSVNDAVHPRQANQ